MKAFFIPSSKRLLYSFFASLQFFLFAFFFASHSYFSVYIYLQHRHSFLHQNTYLYLKNITNDPPTPPTTSNTAHLGKTTTLLRCSDEPTRKPITFPMFRFAGLFYTAIASGLFYPPHFIYNNLFGYKLLA